MKKGKRTGDRKVYEDAVLELLGYDTSITDDEKADSAFYGYMCSQMNMRSMPDDWGADDKSEGHIIAVAATLSGYEIHINLRRFEDKLSPSERRAVLKHEVIHAMGGHPFRQYEVAQSLQKVYPSVPEKDLVSLANISADLTVNQFIKGLPDWAISLDQVRAKFPNVEWKEKDSLENYAHQLLAALADQAGQGGSGNPSEGGSQGDSQASPQEGLTYGLPGEIDDHSEWGEGEESQGDREATIAACEALLPQMVAEAQKMAVLVAGNLSADLEGLIKLVNRKRVVDWRKLLRPQLSFEQRAMREFSLKKTNRRFPDRWEIPGVRKIGGVNVLAILDVSGSVSDHAVSVSLGEVSSLCKMFGITLKLIQVDAEVKSVEKFTGKKTTLERKGYGGTVLYPAVEYAREHKIKHDVLIVITDGALFEDRWEIPPACKTIFLIVGHEGARLSLDTTNFPITPVIINVPENP